MKGLLLKDLALMKTQGRSVVIILIIAIFMLLAGNNTAFAVAYANIIFVMFGINSLSYDTHDNGCAFLFTLPIDRKIYVMEKYVFSLLSMAAGVFFSIIMMIGVSLIKDDYILTTSEFSFVIGYAIGTSVFLSIMLPINLKFGPEKGRIAMIVVVAMIMANVFALKEIAGGIAFSQILVRISAFTPLMIMGILSAVAVLVLLISYLISYKIMMKKEF